MRIGRYLIVGLLIGLMSLAYNSFVFWLFDFFPDIPVDISVFGFGTLNIYFLIFLKNFLVGMILMFLFSVAYESISDEKGLHEFKGIVFFILYGIFALLAFSVIDIFLMGSHEGLLILVTLDGVVEAFIATMPIKFFHRKRES